MPGTARAAAGPRARGKPDEAKLKGVEEARKAAVEVAQEEDAPKEAGPEAAAGLIPQPLRALPQAPAALSREHGVVASLRAPVTM
jgi:hypothetical protein